MSKVTREEVSAYLKRTCKDGLPSLDLLVQMVNFFGDGRITGASNVLYELFEYNDYSIVKELGFDQVYEWKVKDNETGKTLYSGECFGELIENIKNKKEPQK